MKGHLLRSQSLGNPHVLLCTLRLPRSGRLTDSAARTGVGAPYSSHRAPLWPCIWPFLNRLKNINSWTNS